MDKSLVLACLVIALQVADLALTYLGIKAGARESWAPMAFLQKILPGRWTWLFVPKVAVIGGVWWAASAYPGDMIGPFIGLIVFYVWVVANNYRVWSRLR